MTASDFERAVDFHRAGRLQEAEFTYRIILARDPSNADSLNGLGTIALTSGRLDHAVRLIRQAVTLRPDSMAFHSNLGMACQALRQFDHAEHAFHRAIELAPHNAGVAFNLANLLKEQKRYAEAIAHYQRVIRIQPDHVGAFNNLGNCYRDLGRFDEALELLKHAIILRPGFVEAYQNLANVLTNSGLPVEAEACCRKALRLQPHSAAAFLNLGTALLAQKRKDEAVAAYRQASELSPTLPEAHENLGLSLLEIGSLTQGVMSFRRAIEVAPNRAEAWRRLANGFMLQREFNDADTCFQQALNIEPNDPSLLSHWLFWQLYRPESNLSTIAARHAEWNARLESIRHANVVKANAQVPRRDARAFGGCLRLGLVSADFGQHPIGMFSIRTVEALAALGFEIVCYSTSSRCGVINARFKKCAVLWREVQHAPDENLNAIIAADRIDILIDLAGHSAGNRLEVFARRPARVQATWIGSEGTTGLREMDYLIADERIVPPTADDYYTERIVRLPVSYVSWDPPVDARAIAPSPVASGSPPTFCSFNNPAKYHAGVAELWSRILHRVPDSRLLLQSRHLSDESLQQNILALFGLHGIDRNQIEFRDWQPYADVLDNYNRVDIALDPFPFGGGATTCDALWMGVPVVTLPGETFTSRHSCSYLTTIGLTELIASRADDYVEIAIALAKDANRLSQFRSTLRQRIEQSTLCDGQRCAQDLATALRKMWDDTGVR